MEIKKMDLNSLYFLKQLWSETRENLLSLELANNPEAEKHLILFLQAMWMSPDEMKVLLEKVQKGT